MLITVTTTPTKLNDLFSEEQKRAIINTRADTNMTFAFHALGATGVWIETNGFDADPATAFPLIDGMSLVETQTGDLSLVAEAPTPVRVASV